MELAFARAILPVDSRRAIRFLQPGVQLRLPFYLLVVSLGFAALTAWHVHTAYADLYAMVLSVVPHGFAAQIGEQTRTFLVVSGILGVGYVLVVVCVCVAYTNALIGPTVAIRRQLHALKRGSYTERIRTRNGDAVFGAIASDLNELTRILAAEHGVTAAPSRVEPTAPLPWEGRL